MRWRENETEIEESFVAECKLWKVQLEENLPPGAGRHQINCNQANPIQRDSLYRSLTTRTAVKVSHVMSNWLRFHVATNRSMRMDGLTYDSFLGFLQMDVLPLSHNVNWWSTPRDDAIFSLSFFFFGRAKNLGICEAVKDSSGASSKNSEKKATIVGCIRRSLQIGTAFPRHCDLIGLQMLLWMMHTMNWDTSCQSHNRRKWKTQHMRAKLQNKAGNSWQCCPFFKIPKNKRRAFISWFRVINLSSFLVY